jgi:protein-S-isoprenylcysteine O-methyltransferase Ste14
MKKSKSEKAMTVFGVGPKLDFWTFLYTFGIVGLCVKFPSAFHMAFLPSLVRLFLGILLVLAGGTLYILSIKTIFKGFQAGKLMTNGVYGLCRHPIYASWGIAIVPGIALLCDNWAALSISIFLCAVTKLLVAEEERWLEKKFGKKYKAYQRQVPGLLPLGGLKTVHRDS